MKFRDLVLTIFWKPPPSLRGAMYFAIAGSTFGFVVGFYYFQARGHAWLCIPLALIGDIAGAGVYLALLSFGVLRSIPPKTQS